jgi:hypothetical protein
LAEVTTIAAALGVLTGLLMVGFWLGGLTPLHDSWVTPTLALSIILILVSLVAFVGPKRILYGSALFSALLAVSEWVGAGSDGTVFTVVMLAMAALTMVLGVVAARAEPRVSEESHPMNLPVFG